MKNAGAHTGRKFYAKKSEWARAQADEVRKTIETLRFTSSRGSSLRAARKYQSIDNLYREVQRYERMALRYEREGN